MGLLVLAAFSLGSAGCPAKSDDDSAKKESKSKKKKKAAESESEETDEEEGSATPSATASAAPTETVKPPDPVPTPTPTQTSPPAPAARSVKPEDKDWETAATTTIVGGTPIGCEAKEIREWVRVLCKGTDVTRGVPTAIVLDSGDVENETFVSATQGTTTFIYSYIEGRNVKATFAWTREKRGYTAEWAAGTPKPASRGVFAPTAEKIDDTNKTLWTIECRSDASCGGKKCCAGIGTHCMTQCAGSNGLPTCTSDAECARKMPSLRNPVCRPNGNWAGVRTCQAGRVVEPPAKEKERTPRDPKRDEATGKRPPRPLKNK